MTAFPRRLVVRLPNWLGDIVMAMPALGAVRARFPDAHLAVAAPEAVAPLAMAFSGADEVVPLVVGRSWRDRQVFADDTARLRRGRFDTAILFTNSFASALMVKRAGIAERWGYRSDFRGRLLTCAFPRPTRRVGQQRHHAWYYSRLVELLGCDAPAPLTTFDVPEAWRATARRLLEAHGVSPNTPVVGFAPGAAYGTAKQWPPRRVAEVVARCLGELEATCVLCGAPGDAGTSDAILRELALRGLPAADPASEGAPRVVDLVGATDLPTLAGVMASCAGFVCNDSGPMHLASAIGVQVVAVFGATDEQATAPLGPHTVVLGEAWCRPCLRRECPLDHRCMWGVSPAAVFEPLRGTLALPRARD